MRRLLRWSSATQAALVVLVVVGSLSGIIWRTGTTLAPHGDGVSHQARPAEVAADLRRVGLVDSAETAHAVDLLLRVLRRHPVLAKTFVTPRGIDIAALALWSISAPDPNRLELLNDQRILRDFATAMGVFPVYPDIFGSVSRQILTSGIGLNGPAIGELAVALSPRAQDLADMGVTSIDDSVPAGRALAWALTVDPKAPEYATVINNRAYYYWALDAIGKLDTGLDGLPELGELNTQQ